MNRVLNNLLKNDETNGVLGDTIAYIIRETINEKNYDDVFTEKVVKDFNNHYCDKNKQYNIITKNKYIIFFGDKGDLLCKKVSRYNKGPRKNMH